MPAKRVSDRVQDEDDDDEPAPVRRTGTQVAAKCAPSGGEHSQPCIGSGRSQVASAPASGLTRALRPRVPSPLALCRAKADPAAEARARAEAARAKAAAEAERRAELARAKAEAEAERREAIKAAAEAKAKAVAQQRAAVRRASPPAVVVAGLEGLTLHAPMHCCVLFGVARVTDDLNGLCFRPVIAGCCQEDRHRRCLQG